MVPERADVVLYGRGFKDEYLVFVDGLTVNPRPPVGDDMLRFPISAYPGKKELTARVEIRIESRDGTMTSNACSVEYPGDFPFFLGAASGLSLRNGDPAAMLLGFLGLPGSSQQEVPSKHSDGRPMSGGARFLRRLYIVAGTTSVSQTEGPPLTLGVGLRLVGEFRFLYAVRFNGDDYPHHIFAFAGTVNVHNLIRKFE